MSQPNDLSRSLVSLEQDVTLVAVVELSQSSWLIAGTVPGIERQPLKKIVTDEAALLHRWCKAALAAISSSSRPFSSVMPPAAGIIPLRHPEPA
jgi:transposase